MFMGTFHLAMFVLNAPLFFAAGIVNPIEAKVRKGKGAVGAYGNERTQQSLQDFPVIDSEEEEEKVHFIDRETPCIYFCIEGSSF